MTTAASDVPKRLNGYPVIHAVPDAGRWTTVLVFREGKEPHPFVVAGWLPDLGETWAHGNYVATLAEAMAIMPEPRP